MAMDFLKGSVHKTGLIITPKGRLIYPDLFHKSWMKGENKTDDSKGRYRATLLFPKAADLSILLKAVNDAAFGEWGANPKFKVKKPFLKTEDQPRLAELAADFPTFIRLSSSQKPDIALASAPKVPVTDESEVYGGRWAVISLNANTWSHDTGGKGVSLYMNHVMLLDHDEPLGSSRPKMEDVFEAVEGAGDASASASSLFD